jgi:hypothetical protein
MRGNRDRSNVVTLEEAERIARTRLPEEPGEDWLASWQAARPQPEPPKEPRKLDTSPVDVAAVVRGAIRAERSFTSEVTGLALGQVRNEIFDAVDDEIAKLKAEVERLRAEFAQADALRELRAELKEIKDLLAKRARPSKAPAPQLPAPANGDARPQ